MIGLLMFSTALVLLLVGFPVAFTFGGVAVFFWRSNRRGINFCDDAAPHLVGDEQYHPDGYPSFYLHGTCLTKIEAGRTVAGVDGISFW